MRSARGAIMVQTAVMLVAILGMTGLVIDYGVLWGARAQAQNAADAGALASATALAFDSVLDSTLSPANGIAAAARNAVWGAAPTVTADATINDPSCNIPNVPAPPVVPRLITCVTVSVYRNGEQNSTKLPTFFTKLVGVTDQGVKARAVGTAIPANSSRCVWPIAIPDKWSERSSGGTWQVTSTFDKYSSYPTVLPSATLDTYTAPSPIPPPNGLGTGFSLSSTTLSASPAVTLSLTRVASFNVPISASNFVPVHVPGASFTGALGGCNGSPVNIGDDLAYDGSGTDPQVMAAGQLRFDRDAGAQWVGSPTFRVISSCASTASCGTISPRTVLLPLFDPDYYETTRWPPGSTPRVRVTNFVGFFIDPRPSTALVGHFTTFPGDVNTSLPQVGYFSAFLRAAVLSR